MVSIGSQEQHRTRKPESQALPVSRKEQATPGAPAVVSGS